MSFLSDYRLYNSGNEANPNYHYWSGLSALSSIISRRVWVDMGYFRIYPNLYVVLVGPPGNKKTTAMSVAKNLIRHLAVIPFSAECQTKESFVKELADYEKSFEIKGLDKPYKYTPMSVFVTELSQFIGVDPARMIDFLTTIYDQDFYDLRTKNKGSQFIVGPYVTVLACTTPDWITSYLKTDVITGGFSRRAIFVLEYDDSDTRIPFPVLTPEMRTAWDNMITYAHILFTVGGEFKWDTGVKDYYSDWYLKRTISADPLIHAFDATAFIQIMKLAMLISVSESPDLIITRSQLDTAMAMVDMLKVNLPKVFQGIGRNELNIVKMKILSILQTTGPVPEKKLFALVWSELPRGGADFDTLLRDMEKSDSIRRLQKKVKEGEQAGPIIVCTVEQAKKLTGEQSNPTA